MTFRECIQNDIMNVFFREDFFTEKHDVNGRACDALMRKNALEAADSQQILGRTAQGLYNRLWTLYLPVHQYGEKPAVDSLIRVDRHQCFRVKSVVDQMGVYKIEMEETA